MSPVDYSGKAVLIVDSDAEVRSKISTAIRKISMKILTVEAVDGQDALGRLKNKPFDIVIAGKELPKLSLPMVIKQMRESLDFAPPKSLLLLCDSKDVQDVSWPNLAFLPKPFDDSALTNHLVTELQKLTVALENEAAAPASKGKKIDVEFINPFISATLEVLAKTCNTKATKDKLFLRSENSASGDISAFIGMTFPGFRGSFGIAFSKKCFLFLVNNMLGENYKEINPENQDAAGEICNQVFGVAKVVLNERGYKLEPAIPSIVVGDNHRIKHLVSGPIIAVQFETEGGHFILETAFSS